MRLSEMGKYERAQVVSLSKRLLGMAMDTPEGVDFHFNWSPHVDWIVVSINHNALYVDEEHKDYNPERERKHYQRMIEFRHVNPVVALLKTIEECQQVLDNLKKTEAQEVA